MEAAVFHARAALDALGLVDDVGRAHRAGDGAGGAESGAHEAPLATLDVNVHATPQTRLNRNLGRFAELSQGVEQGGYDVARLIDRLIRNPEAEWEDVMVMPLNIITRQSTDIYANNDPHIAEVLRYIHENISQKITVDDLVKLVPLSRRLLETRFKKSMGTSIYDYIIQTRIEKMMQLLCEGLSVSEAAAELGFSDIKNVSRTFRQLKGITPSEYREQVAPKRR